MSFQGHHPICGGKHFPIQNIQRRNLSKTMMKLFTIRMLETNIEIYYHNET